MIVGPEPPPRADVDLEPYISTQVFQKISPGDGREPMFAASECAGYNRIELSDAFLAHRRAGAAVRFRRPGIAQILTTADGARDLHAKWINTRCNPKKGRGPKTDFEPAAAARSCSLFCSNSQCARAPVALRLGYRLAAARTLPQSAAAAYLTRAQPILLLGEEPLLAAALRAGTPRAHPPH